MTLSRRELLAASGVAVAFTGAIDALFTANPAAGSRGPKAGYGPLQPDPNGILDLPEGFTYKVISREGDPLKSGGGLVPGRCDGMGFFRDDQSTGRLVRNHENRQNAPLTVPAPLSHTYDPTAKGGTTTLLMGPDHELREEYASLGGTAVNCAGGITPWRTWLTCEENESKAGEGGYTKDHGFIFEVDPYDNARNADPTPLKEMGRFQHEAIAVDPHTGIVYETEDAFEAPFGLFYRFKPNKPLGGYGSLRAGGVLEAMRVPGVADLSTIQETGTEIGGIEWVKVPDPLASTVPTKDQDYGSGGITHAQKLEGCWWGDGAAYFVASFGRADDGSPAEHDGQVWRYDPDNNTLRLEVIFTRDADTPVDQPFQEPDNICLSPYGGLMMCEDGDGEQYILGVTAGGEPFHFARNRQNTGTPVDPSYGEFAGVVFDDRGKTLYFNCYNPGTTFAVTGPWKRQS
ncbi:MAG: alkaline phosphatase PhoX [Micromonosporaceae bacterium]